MPWKECHVVDERLRFVARRLDGEKMTALCAEFGISRKTGYKIYERYKDCGVEGLTDQPAALPTRPAAPNGGREADCGAEAGVSRLGRPKRFASLKGTNVLANIGREFVPFRDRIYENELPLGFSQRFCICPFQGLFKSRLARPWEK